VNNVLWFGGPTQGPIARFLKRTLRNQPEEQQLVLSAIQILETTSLDVLAKTGKVGKVKGPIREYRINAKAHWIRILLAQGKGTDIHLLHVVLKKQNRLDAGDVQIAEGRFKRL